MANAILEASLRELGALRRVWLMRKSDLGKWEFGQLTHGCGHR
jgi:hypothetical protein